MLLKIQSWTWKANCRKWNPQNFCKPFTNIQKRWGKMDQLSEKQTKCPLTWIILQSSNWCFCCRCIPRPDRSTFEIKLWYCWHMEIKVHQEWSLWTVSLQGLLKYWECKIYVLFSDTHWRLYPEDLKVHPFFNSK